MKEKLIKKGITRRLFSVVLSLAMVLSLMPMNSLTAFVAEPTKIGTSTTYWIIEDGTLTISCSGAMPDYSFEMSIPWYSNKDNITNVVIGDEVTAIGQKAFLTVAA